MRSPGHMYGQLDANRFSTDRPTTDSRPRVAVIVNVGDGDPVVKPGLEI